MTTSVSNLRPIEIRRQLSADSSQGTGLAITWSDGAQTLIPAPVLRRACPCATCAENRGDTSHAAPLSAKSSLLRVVKASSDEATSLQEVWAVGNYAVGIRWGDAHDTGIYHYALLHELGNVAREQTNSNPIPSA